jgi:hypothetical protein
MPYAVPARATRESRLEGAEVLWRALLATRPQLERAVALQRDLLGQMFDLTEMVERSPLPRVTLPAKYIAAKLADGKPVLAGEPLPLPITTLAPAMPGYCDALERHGAGASAANIKACLVETRIEPGALLNAAVRRQESAVRQLGARHGLASELVWLVAELASSPYIHVLQSAFLGRANAEPALKAALDAWPHGYCPYCGSWPSVVETLSGDRFLRCSFCALAWQLLPDACIYCRNAGPTFERVAPDTALPGRTVDLCGQCRLYIKSVTVPNLSVFPLLLIVDMDTMDLDLAAIDRKFKRPALKSFTPV